MITDPQAVTFSNEVIRPLAEEARGLIIRIAAAKTTWFGGMNGKFPNTSEVLDDGRSDEGIPILTGANVNSFMGVIIAIESASNAEIIQKPAVRTLP